MKREEKNKQVIRKIVDSARLEFGSNGYGLSSINTICTRGGISKGVLYHHFKDKDELYLTCIKECFENLLKYLQKHISENETRVERKLQIYFDARLAFFEENPIYQKLFCSAVVSPPSHLIEDIMKARVNFDAFNIAFLTQMLEQVQLRPGVTSGEVVDFFCSYQDFVNAHTQMELIHKATIEKQEKMRQRAIQILLYGVVERGEDKGCFRK